MANRLPITIRVDHFEGPLDLLLYLIQSHELDVSKVSISKITDQYLAYVRLMQELNFDVASDFLLMAATLIQWKSKSLLPQEVDPNATAVDGDDALTPEELLRQLMEHQRFLEMGRELSTLTLLGEDVYTRPNSRKPTERVWKQMDVSALATTYQDLLVKERKRTTILKKETVSLAEKIHDFADRMEVGQLTGLRTLLRDPNSRPETVVSFLASLELGRLKKMRLFQEKVYEEIYVELLESIKGFDTSLASGFDSIEAAVDKGVAEKHAHDAGGADLSAAAGDSAEGLVADQPRTSDATSGVGGTAGSTTGISGTSDATSGISGVEDSARSGNPAQDSTRAGGLAQDSARAGDLGSFGESSTASSVESSLGELVSGTHHGGRESSVDSAFGEELAGRNPGATDGGRDADFRRHEQSRDS